MLCFALVFHELLIRGASVRNLLVASPPAHELNLVCNDVKATQGMSATPVGQNIQNAILQLD